MSIWFVNGHHPVTDDSLQDGMPSRLRTFQWKSICEFHDAGMQFPVNPVETTSAFATLSMLQKNPTMVALLSTDVAKFCTSFGMVCILPMQLKSRSESYFLVSRRDRKLTPVAQLFIEEFGLAPAGDLRTF